VARGFSRKITEVGTVRLVDGSGFEALRGCSCGTPSACRWKAGAGNGQAPTFRDGPDALGGQALERVLSTFSGDFKIISAVPWTFQGRRPTDSPARPIPLCRWTLQRIEGFTEMNHEGRLGQPKDGRIHILGENGKGADNARGRVRSGEYAAACIETSRIATGQDRRQ